MFPPDGLLTFEYSKHDVELHPYIASDPFLSDDCFNAYPPFDLFLLTATEELNMITSEDEPSSGLNGRLRPRKTHPHSPQNKTKTKSDGKVLQDKSKRTSTPSKAKPNKNNDLANKSDFSSTPQFLCPYCDKKFASKQTVSKHFRRMHFATTKQDFFQECLFCNHTEADVKIIRHMVDSHPNQYFACLDCQTRFPSTTELAEHKFNVCEKQKTSFRTKLRQRGSGGTKKSKKSFNDQEKEAKDFQHGHGFNGIVISCELKPSQVHDGADIEENITTNLILPPNKNLGNNTVIEKNAVIVLDDIQWNKRIPPNFSFNNTDADQILSRLGVVQRSTRTAESTRKDWFKAIDDSTQKFEKCFDTKFYSQVASNVQENLAKFLDGSFNFNPDPDSTIKTRKSKNSVAINTAEGFPILLACEQYSRNMFDSYLPRAIAPKHKWKWDNLDTDKTLVNPDQIKRDSHTNQCIITLVANLDIWTQLSMRRKFEEKYKTQPLEKKTEKQNTISKELKEILESREIPTSSQVVRRTHRSFPSNNANDFPASLGLTPAPPTYDVRPAVLSGEWVRPRCYVCCACGEQTYDSKGLSSHISTEHPNANVQYYEIVGEPLLNADILKHLYVPPSQVSNRTRPPRGYRECTKCKKSITLEDLHQHMLDCAGDTPAVRRRQCRSRPFGVRRRRPRMPDNTIRKKMRKDIRSRPRRQKSHMRPRPRIRTEVGDAETIRKMLADLPAKRHRVLVNPTNMMPRQRRRLDVQRNKLLIKKGSAGDANYRKKCTNQGNSERKVEYVNSDDPNKNSSSLTDDEDNKPLKPKLKSLIHRKTRQRESFKRQSIIKRAKRKSVRVEQKKVLENKDNVLNTSSSTSIALFEDSPQKVDLKNAPINIRKHGNRSASNSKDVQRPGCSGTNGTTNNPCAPTQNCVPLKHSIARLTADSERHDKSVQFHHSFLVQQECNSTNHHDPSGQQTLFENEAVITKLDKPPLNFSQKSFLDFQKSKLNKPRKGLNDCIAMLKNKLVDPVSFEGTGQVSVQCGSDEPIDSDPRPLFETAVQAEVSIMTDPQPVSRRNSLQMEHHSFQNKLELQSKELLLSAKCNNIPGKIKLTHGSLVSNVDSEVKMGNEITKPNKVKSSTYKCIEQNNDKSSVKTSRQNLSLITGSKINDLDKLVLDNSRKNESVKIAEILQGSELKKDWKNPIEKVTSQNLTEQNTCAVPTRQNVTEKNTCAVPARANTYTQSIILPLHTDTCLENESNLPMTVDVFSDKNFSDVPVGIPPAHASTHVESIISTPLDLSSKMVSGCHSKSLSNTEDSYYDSYETLDLSNKNSGNRTTSETIYMEDVVVDLRVKPSASRSEPSTLDLCLKSIVNKTSDASDMSIPRFVDHLPTDLSVRGLNLSSVDRVDNATFVYDLSSANAGFSQNERKNISGNREKNTALLSKNVIKSTEPQVRGLKLTSLDSKSSSLILACGSNSNVSKTTGIVTLEKSTGKMACEKLSDLQLEPKQNVNPESKNTKINQQRVESHRLEQQKHAVERQRLEQQMVEQQKIEKHVDRHKIEQESFEHQKVEKHVLEIHRFEQQNIEQHLEQHKARQHIIEQPKVDHMVVERFRAEQNVERHRVEQKSVEEQVTDQQNVEQPKAEQHRIVENNILEKNSSITEQAHIIIDRASIPKPVYDPTLKIPQYKIRETATADVKISQCALSKSPRGHHENLTYGLGNSANITSISAVVGPSAPLHSLTSRTMTSATSRMESTTAVYTLANACITVTKIESPITNTLTNALLSIPGSTIASTTPVYTLTGTTMGAPTNYGAVSETEFHETASYNYLPPTSLMQGGAGLKVDIERSSFKANEETLNDGIKNDKQQDVQDPETARKIAMLPKELVEILGNMPIDHRNQLLNVLPQYVSTPAAPSELHCETNQAINDTNMLTTKKIASTAGNNEITLKNKVGFISEPGNVLSSSNVILHSSTVRQVSQTCSPAKQTQTIVEIPSTSFNVVSSVPLDITKCKPLEMNENIPPVLHCTKDRSINSDSEKALIDPAKALNTKKVTDYPNNSDKVIDLTEDDIFPLNLNTAKVTNADVPETIKFINQEVLACTVLEKSSKQKMNNDKTASLRAVRIKAPSERKKENQILKRTSLENDSAPNLLRINENINEENKSFESNKSLAIQQAEVSSTQHNNKSVVVINNDAADSLPTELGSNTDNSKANSERLLTVAVETEKDTSKDRVNKSPSVKSSLVTSSNIANQNLSNNGFKGIDVPQKEYIDEPIHKTAQNSAAAEGLVHDLKADTENNIGDKSPEDGKCIEANEEEDSDDDIILAAIVKQKQREQKGNLNVCYTKKRRATRKRKNGKKSKKIWVSEHPHKKTGVKYDLVYKPAADKPQVVEDKDLAIDNCNSEIINDKNCLQTIGCNVNEKRNIAIESRTLQAVNDNTKIGAMTLEVTNSHISVLDNYSSASDETNSLLLKSQLDISLNKLADSQHGENVNQKEKCKNEKKQIEFLVDDTTKQQNKGDCANLTRLDFPDQANETNDIIVKKNSAELNDSRNDSSPTSYQGCIKKLDSADKSFTETFKGDVKSDLELCREIEENLNVPLRRSRRGKSLFMDSGLSEHEIITDNIKDQKIPFTKKQLIFSKLLCDEENHTKSIKKCALTAKQDNPNNEQDVPNIGNTPVDLVPDSSEQLIAKAPDKCKPIKRKRIKSFLDVSPQVKRKNKKKKLTVMQCTEDNMVSRDFESNDEDVSKNSSEPSPSKSSDNKKSIEVKPDELNENVLNAGRPPEKVAQNFSGTDKSDVVVNFEKNEDSVLDNNNAISRQTKLSPSEKRKITNAAISLDCSPTTKPKKTKYNKDKETIAPDTFESIEAQTSASNTKQTEIEACVPRSTTCYSAPVAARTTRSKSVAIKPSSAELYDPYDIDLDEMIETPELLKKSVPKSKDTRIKNRNISKLTELQTSENKEFPELEKNNKKHKLSNNKEQPDNQPPKHTCSKVISNTRAEDSKCDQISKESKGRTTLAADVTNSTVKSNNNESDDSAKSINLSGTANVPQVDTKDVDVKHEKRGKQKNNNFGCKKNRQSTVTNSNADASKTLDESEEQLRSEQFMESFGFFSERKPRKSNLLASKKISETFHIIANESDDIYFKSKERATKKTSNNESKKSVEGDGHVQLSPSKKNIKRGRKKKDSLKVNIRYCVVCKKEFRRPDNYVRHLMTLIHVSKLSEVEMKMKTIPIPEEPNYLIAYKQQLDRLKILTDKLIKEKRKKNFKTKIVLPTLEEILAEVHKSVREQQLSRRGLSRDEELFIDCCELLKESHKPDIPISDPMVISNHLNNYDHPGQSSAVELEYISKSVEKSDSKSDEDLDSITAKSILESEEVRNLENDLISGLKEAASANSSLKNMEYHHPGTSRLLDTHESFSEMFSTPCDDPHCHQMKIINVNFDVRLEPDLTENKRHYETKDKMYPDIEDIDIFEDKFDKIKRKCRSQAAAAKQVQPVVKPTPGHKGRKKSEKKKGKKSAKKNYQNTVLTKGALKGFDGIKVSIPTSDINISAIVPLHDSLPKKRKRTSSKKKREKKDSETSSKNDSDHRFKDGSQKKVDVYEFLDNEDAELFEFRPSTLMERFKSISNKDMPSTSKHNSTSKEQENTSETASDGDDFVYMSDDYVCSEDETENSFMSCELGQLKIDTRKSTGLKRKDIVEKNAVMGKIFKHNAVRAEKKSVKSKVVKPTANLDQLFDSLLEEEPNSSVLNNDSDSTKLDIDSRKDETYSKDETPEINKRSLTNKAESRTGKNKLSLATDSTKPGIPIQDDSSPHKYDINSRYACEPSISKKDTLPFDIYGPSTSKMFDEMIPKDYNAPTPKKHDNSSSKKYDASLRFNDSPTFDDIETSDFKGTSSKESSLSNLYDRRAEFEDETGVARQRARRKCTVGKQNVLAETWSSESEPDGVPARPNSAESVVTGAGRKKKGRKKEAQQSLARRGKVLFKKQDIGSRVNSNTTSNVAGAHSTTSTRVTSGVRENSGVEKNEAVGYSEQCASPIAVPSTSQVNPSGGMAHGSKVRPRSAAYYWSSEGDEEQEHVQQHGWIVGDSHKKLVTMLAHAKGRKRNNDDKRHLIE